jgi:hypothetical protein
MKFLYRIAAAFLAAALLSSSSSAELWTTQSGAVTAGGRAANASADFTVNSDGNLAITLTNLALAANVKTPGDVLTNLEFNLTGATLAVTKTSPGSVNVAGGSSVLNFSSNPTDISNAWAFATSVQPQGSGVPAGTVLDYGVSATGWLPTTTPGQIRMDGTKYGGTGTLGQIDGSDFGLVPKGTSLTNFPNNPYALVADTVHIVIPVTGTLNVSNISDVWFTYGSEQEGQAGVHGIPEPSTLAIAGLGSLGFLAYGLRRRKTQ